MFFGFIIPIFIHFSRKNYCFLNIYMYENKKTSYFYLNKNTVSDKKKTGYPVAGNPANPTAPLNMETEFMAKSYSN